MQETAFKHGSLVKSKNPIVYYDEVVSLESVEVESMEVDLDQSWLHNIMLRSHIRLLAKWVNSAKLRTTSSIEAYNRVLNKYFMLAHDLRAEIFSKSEKMKDAIFSSEATENKCRAKCGTCFLFLFLLHLRICVCSHVWKCVRKRKKSDTMTPDISECSPQCINII